MANDQVLRSHLAALLNSEAAHINFDPAVANLADDLQGKLPSGTAHTPWQVLEHMRITQRDVLDRIGNANHRALKFPDEYWPPPLLRARTSHGTRALQPSTPIGKPWPMSSPKPISSAKLAPAQTASCSKICS